MIVLDRLSPAAEQGWRVLFDLHVAFPQSCVLIGGQMMYLLAVENGVPTPRATDDVDVVVNVRLQPEGTREVAEWLEERGFRADQPSAESVGHRFRRAAEPGPGTIIFDILGPEGLGSRTSLETSRGVRTVAVPGSVQAISRAEVVAVTLTDMTGVEAGTGNVRRPDLLGALIIKAAATAIPVRPNPERDWQDAALLLSLLPDPLAIAERLDRGDRRRLRLLAPLSDPMHSGWSVQPAASVQAGIAALEFLVEPS